MVYCGLGEGTEEVRGGRSHGGSMNLGSSIRLDLPHNKGALETRHKSHFSYWNTLITLCQQNKRINASKPQEV